VTDPKEKTKPVVPTREPKKKTQGIFDNLRKIPESHPVEEILGLSSSSTGSTPSRPSTDTTGSTPSRPSTQPAIEISPSQAAAPIAPERDYTKVANSIVRQAVPSGIFGDSGGKSKQLYDYLYLQTRGAVVPKRKVRIPKEKLMRGSGIGSEVTLRKNLMRLRVAKLVKEAVVPGTHGGNEYEVFLPEEIGIIGLTPSTPSRGGRDSNPRQLREGLPPLEATPSRASLSQVVAIVSGECKTSSSDVETIDDDAALAGLVSALKTLNRELTGKDLSTSETARWSELAEVLVTEAKIAAARTNVSSVPSFLAEHLRRRLWKKDKHQLIEEGQSALVKDSPAISKEQLNRCPDCGGSGFYYPEGFEGGVAKCRHQNLKEPVSGQPKASDAT